MKTIMLIVMLTVPALGVNCGVGCFEYQGACACNQAPAEVAPSVKPSDEKPPRSGQHDVNGAMPQSLIYQDAKHDQEVKDADAAGKHAAGID